METNYDRVMRMSIDELVELWSRTNFPEEFQADCQDCPRNDNCDFTWYACPETFRNWLKGEYENENGRK